MACTPFSTILAIRLKPTTKKETRSTSMTNTKSHHLSYFDRVEPGHVPKADFHLHTTWTDGANSVPDMHRRAEELELKCVLFSEHGRRSSGDWFPSFADEVRQLKGDFCRALVGLETKVTNFDGELDTTDAIVGECDLVMASVHRFPKEVNPHGNPDNLSADEVIETEFRLARAALSNPKVDILGHPFGMCLQRFGVAAPDDLFLELIEEAARFQVAFEINPQYHKDLWKLIGWCVELGAPISLGSNAHDLDSVGRVLESLGKGDG